MYKFCHEYDIYFIVWSEKNIISWVVINLFASVFEKEWDEQLPHFPEQPYTTELDNINITEENVYRIMSVETIKIPRSRQFPS